MNNRVYSFSIIILLFFNVNVLAQSDDVDRPFLTQQIDQGKVVLAGSTVALLPESTSMLSAVTAEVVAGSCSAFYQVQCHRWNDSSRAWDCGCQMFYCSSGWTPGVCP